MIQDDLLDQNPQHTPVVPGVCDPIIGINMGNSIEAGRTRRDIVTDDGSIVPGRGQTCFPGLQVMVEFQSRGTDDSRVGNLTAA